ALHVDDGAERAFERAAATGVEAGHQLVGTFEIALRQDRRGRRLNPGQLVDVIVDRLELAVYRVVQQRVAAVLDLAGIKCDAELERLLQIGLLLADHGETAGYMKPADRDRDSGRAQRARDVERARELVALDPDQEDEPEIVVPAKPPDDLGRPDARADLVGGVDVDLDIVAEHAALPGIL